jgi:hypothetical protein
LLEQLRAILEGEEEEEKEKKKEQKKEDDMSRVFLMAREVEKRALIGGLNLFLP